MKTRQSITLLSGFVCLLVGLSSMAWGQSIGGRIVGTIRDASGAVVPGATITITDTARGTTRTVSTDNLGDYTVPALPPGTYQVAAEQKGFRRAVVAAVTLEVNQTTRIDLTLEVGEMVQEVKVTATAAQLESQTSALGQVVHSQQIVEMPLNGRNYVQLALLSTGVAALPEGGFSSTSYALTNRTNASVVINGNREGDNSWLLDGVESKNPWLGMPNLQPSIDAIQEFKIQRNNYGAEFGDGSGIINIATKSGANAVHGSAYEFLRNDALDARNFFDGNKVPPLRQNQWGGTLGGPIVKNRTFIFGAYESLREHRTITIRSLFPDRQQLAGNFSSSSSPVYDPSTGNYLLCMMGVTFLCPTAFSGNIIPANRLNQVAQNVAAYWPAPNLTGDPAVNHVTTAPGINDYDQFQLRLDHRFSDKDQLFVRYSFMDGRNQNPGAAKYLGQIFPQRPQNAVINYTHIFSPTLLNEFRLGYNRVSFYSIFEKAPTNISAEAGLQHLDGLPAQAWGLPSIGIVGYYTGMLGSLGPPTPNSQFNKANVFQFVDHITWTRGRHTVKTGADIRKVQNYLASGIIVNGTFNFQGLYTGNALADYVVGMPLVVIAGAGVGVADNRSTQWAGFVQDDIRVTPNLTLNIGMRYEYFQPQVDTQDRLGLWEDGQLYYVKDVINRLPENLRSVAHVGGVSRGIVEPDRNNFGPRFGFAYRPMGNEKTVIRGGYGVFYASGHAGSDFYSQLPPFVNFTFDINNLVYPLNPTPVTTLSDLLRDPLTATQDNIMTSNRHDRDQYMQQWNFTIQRELFRDTLFEIAYSGQVGHRLWKRYQANQAEPGDPTTMRDRVPYPLYGEILYSTNVGNSNYHALQARVDKRFSNGLSFLAAYTWSKSIDFDSGVLEAASTQSRFNLSAERAPSDYDVPHQFVLSYVYELPFGKGKHWGGGVTGVPRHLISGWELSGITTFAAGTPFYVTSSTQNGSSVIFGANRANRVCDGNLPASQQTPQRWFDTSCFVDHPAGEFGNSGRNILRQSGRNIWDMSVMKDTAISERVTVQFRAEFYNFFNHTNFARPGADVGIPATFGVVTQNLRANGRSREIQFGLKLLF